MFTMIFVNDLAGAPRGIVPWWMRHFKADGNGMTFVDLVFPAFLFIVGMSIPFGLGSQLNRGLAREPVILEASRARQCPGTDLPAHEPSVIHA